MEENLQRPWNGSLFEEVVTLLSRRVKNGGIVVYGPGERMEVKR